MAIRLIILLYFNRVMYTKGAIVDKPATPIDDIELSISFG